MADIVLIAGTHHGGWYWDPIADHLRMAGHRVFAPSLTSLDDLETKRAKANLDTHINDVLRVIADNQVRDLVLVGHSYGGMVITGVADRTSTSVRSLIYLDAALPFSGESEWKLNSQWLRERYISTVIDGFNIEVPEEFLAFRPRLMPHPLATKLQPLHFEQQKLDALSKIYVHAENGFEPGAEHFFARGYQRSLVEPNWVTHTLASGHDLVTELPQAVIDIILDAAI